VATSSTDAPELEVEPKRRTGRPGGLPVSHD
jgi:hypothetical protein